MAGLRFGKEPPVPRRAHPARDSGARSNAKVTPSLTPNFRRLPLPCQAAACYRRQRSAPHPGPGSGPEESPPRPPTPLPGPRGAALTLPVEEEPADERPRPRLPSKLVPRGRQQHPAATSASRSEHCRRYRCCAGSASGFQKRATSPVATANYGAARRTKLVSVLLLSAQCTDSILPPNRDPLR